MPSLLRPLCSQLFATDPICASLQQRAFDSQRAEYNADLERRNALVEVRGLRTPARLLGAEAILCFARARSRSLSHSTSAHVQGITKEADDDREQTESQNAALKGTPISAALRPRQVRSATHAHAALAIPRQPKCARWRSSCAKRKAIWRSYAGRPPSAAASRLLTRLSRRRTSSCAASWRSSKRCATR